MYLKYLVYLFFTCAGYLPSQISLYILICELFKLMYCYCSFFKGQYGHRQGQSSWRVNWFIYHKYIAYMTTENASFGVIAFSEFV